MNIISNSTYSILPGYPHKQVGILVSNIRYPNTIQIINHGTNILYNSKLTKMDNNIQHEVIGQWRPKNKD